MTTSRREPPRPGNEAHRFVLLRRAGLSSLGIQQALAGRIISTSADRTAIARILIAFTGLPSRTALEVFDYPGEFALKKAGEAEVRRE